MESSTELEQRLAASALALLADVRARLVRIAEALADGEYDLAFHMVEDLETELTTRRLA